MGGRKDQHKIDGFINLMEKLLLEDIRFKGQMFTWTNNRRGGDRIMERLDRVLANQSWCAKFPSTQCIHELIIGSDHAPISLHLAHTEGKGRKRFQFENMWLEKE